MARSHGGAHTEGGSHSHGGGDEGGGSPRVRRHGGSSGSVAELTASVKETFQAGKAKTGRAASSSGGASSGSTPAKKAPGRKAAGTGKPKKEIPKEVIDNWNRGTQFNKDREPHYTARGGGNELTLDNGKRVDSYIPEEEIVSRKHTQLAEVKEETAFGYLTEADSKYKPGTVVKDTPHARGQIGDYAGKELVGDLYLEVPPQHAPVPKNVLDKAGELDITIRDTDGKEYS